MCAKLQTVAASNNRDHLTISLYYCLFAPHIHTSRTSRSWWITHSTQRHRRGCNSSSHLYISCAFQPLALAVVILCSFWNGYKINGSILFSNHCDINVQNLFGL